MNKVEKLIYGILRNIAKRKLTNNLGRVVEEEGKLICYVKKEKIKDKSTICCYGIPNDLKDFAKKFKLNKPICYVFDSIDLSENKRIFGYNNCEVIIKNCKFNFRPFIHINGKCTLEDIIIKDYNLLIIGADELIIKNMNLNNLYLFAGRHSYAKIDAKKSIKIIDSNIGKEDIAINLGLFTDDLEIINSKISGDDVECKSKKINIDENSTLSASNKVEIEADDFNSINVSSPVIILNGEKVSNAKEKVTLKKVTDLLVSKRMELLNVLKTIKNNCESANSQMTLQYQEELNNQPINKTLRKIDK